MYPAKSNLAMTDWLSESIKWCIPTNKLMKKRGEKYKEMAEEVQYLSGNLKDEFFQDILLEALNPRETKRLISVVTELVANGHTNLYIKGEFKEHEKYIWVKDCDIPEVKVEAEDACYSFDSCQPSQLGGYWLSGAPSSWMK